MNGPHPRNSVRLVAIALVIVCGSSVSAASAGEAYSYRPHPHRFPQIIQAKDYATIVTIEDLYVELKVVQNERKRTNLDVNWRIRVDDLVIRGPTGNELLVRFPAGGPIQIAQRLYRDGATVVAFRTLRRILIDHQDDHAQRVWYAQWKNSIGQKMTRIEFEAGSKVIKLNSSSYGPTSMERHYIVDLVDRSKASISPRRRDAK